MVLLGMANSRMKDFFDLLVLCGGFSFSGQTLSAAIRATFRRRKTAVPADTPIALTDAFALDPQKQTQWKAFVSRMELSGKAAPLADVINALCPFLLPPLQAVHDKTKFAAAWEPNGPWVPSP